jgi:hypothetical protein
MKCTLAVWLVVSAVASLYYLVCFAAPQLTHNCEAGFIECLMPGNIGQGEQSRRLQECEDATHSYST